MANNRGFLRRKRFEEAPTNNDVDGQAVARVAYELYEQRGRVDGHDLEDWLRAEAIVGQRARQRSAPCIV